MAASESNSKGFPPLVSGAVKVLVLGSLPGVRSLQDQQYYAHPRNAFWKIMGAVAGIDEQLRYADRCQQLLEAGIGLWDVLAESERPGSLDAAIVLATARANDVPALLRQYPAISLLAFNGGKARQLFDRLVLPGLERPPERLSLPSTSPAHAAMSFEQKLQHWSAIRRHAV